MYSVKCLDIIPYLNCKLSSNMKWITKLIVICQCLNKRIYPHYKGVPVFKNRENARS